MADVGEVNKIHRLSHLLKMKAAVETGMIALMSVDGKTVLDLQKSLSSLSPHGLPFSFEVEAGDLLAALGNRLQTINEEIEALSPGEAP